MTQRNLFILLALVVVAAAVGWAAGEAPAAAAVAEPSRVLRVTVPKFVDGTHDLELVLLYRDGRFHAGHALVPGRDNLVHRVDPDPANPFEYVYTDGRKPTITPELTGVYAFSRDDWRTLQGEYDAGKLVIRYLEEVPPLRWDAETQRLSGALDLWVLPMEQPNHWGLAPPTIRPWRLFFNTAVQDGGARGTCEGYSYDPMDMTFGYTSPRRTFPISARWDDACWTPAAGTEYAAGREWPQARGPYLTGSAIDCGQPLIDNLHDARLLWVAEEPLAGGKGGSPKVDFGFYPANFSGWGDGGFGAPVVADGKVYLFVERPDREQARTDPKLREHVVVKRGADPELVAMRQSVVYCFDARTGKTLWSWHSASYADAQSGKGGIGLTPCYLDGRLYARVNGITCFDAKTGAILWQKNDPAFGIVGGWSHEESLVSVGGVLVVVSGQTNLVGVDPATGAVLWRHEKVTGPNQLAAQVTLEGKPYILVSLGQPVGSKETAPPVMSLIQPRTGRVIWQDKRIGYNGTSLLVAGHTVAGNVGPAGANDGPRATGGLSISLAGAQPAWTNAEAIYDDFRVTPLAHDGFLYLDSGISGFAALEASTGRIINRHPHIQTMTSGDHNWTWHVATDNRIVTSGLLLFSTADQGFKRLPGRLSADLAAGYMCPIQPAIADGRLFIRTQGRLLCYDLRKPAELRVDTLALHLSGALLGYTPAEDRLDLQVRMVNGVPRACYASLPVRGADGRPSVAPYLFAPIGTLALTAQGLTGTQPVRVEQHFEPWTLNLTREGNRLAGTATRLIEPLQRPVEVAGKVEGKVEVRADGSRQWTIGYLQAISQRPNNAAWPTQTAYLVVERRADGVTQAWARAGRVNTATHEADVSALRIEGNRITGQVTVIYHSDPYVALNTDTGGALAATYTVDATIGQDGITGTYTGTLGIRYTRTSKVDGDYAAGKDVE